MYKLDVTEVRALLRALIEGLPYRGGKLPGALFSIARQALGITHRPHGIEDAVADLVAKVWTATVHRSPGGALELLSIGEDQKLVAVLKHRLRQVTCSGRRWALMKALRTHVKAVLGGPLPPATTLRVGVMVDGRLCREKIAAAVAVVLSSPTAPPRSVHAVAETLFDLYLSLPMPEPAADVPTPEHLTIESHDAVVHARAVEDLLSPEIAKAIAVRSTGTTLKALAQHAGCSVSTVHGRLRGPHGELRGLCERSGVSPNTHTLAMNLLASGAGR